MRKVDCPKCGADVSETYEPDDWSCGIIGGWYCDACDLGIAEHEIGYEQHDDDVAIGPSPREPGKPLGTPISELSTRPRENGYAEFVRIAKSWGYD